MVSVSSLKPSLRFPGWKYILYLRYEKGFVTLYHRVERCYRLIRAVAPLSTRTPSIQKEVTKAAKVTIIRLNIRQREKREEHCAPLKIGVARSLGVYDDKS